MNEDLKSPREWADVTGIEVLDADGWRGRTGRDFSEPISEDEFRYRAGLSTIRQKRALYDESPKEALDEAMNADPDVDDEEPEVDDPED